MGNFYLATPVLTSVAARLDLPTGTTSLLCGVHMIHLGYATVIDTIENIIIWAQ